MVTRNVRIALRRVGLLGRLQARELLKTMVTASYVRVSSQAQAKKYGPDSQRADIADAVETYALQAPNLTFEDHISAKGEVTRTDFVKMLSTARAGLFQLLLVGRVDRFARNERQAWNYLDELVAAGVVVYFCDEDAAAGLDEDWEDAVSEEISTAAALSRKIGRNVRKARRQQRKRGEFVGRVPDGWRRTESGGLNFDPDRVVLPKRIIELALVNRKSNIEIAATVTDEGFRTRSGGFVNKTYVRELLLNPILYGAWHRGTRGGRENPRYQVDEDMSPPLITKAQFQRIGASMRERARTHTSTTKERHTYVLKRVLRCGRAMAGGELCGSTFGGTTHRRSSGANVRVHVHYRHKLGGCSPDPHDPQATFAEPGVVAQLSSLITRLALPSDALAIAERYMREELERLDPARGQERQRLKQAIARNHRSYRAGGYGDDPEAAELALRADQAPLEATLAALPEPTDVRPQQLQVIRDLPRLWADGDAEVRRQLAEELFLAIYLVRPSDGQVNPRTGKPRRRGLAQIIRVVLRPEYAVLFGLALPAELSGTELSLNERQMEGTPCSSAPTALVVDGLTKLRGWLETAAEQCASGVA